MIQAARYFRIQELVPRVIFDAHEQQDLSRLWLLFDPRVIWTADKIRMRFGKMIANTWDWGGNTEYRGFRPWDSTVGAALSQHKFGRALDLAPQKVTAEEIRQDILRRPDLDEYKFIRCIEAGTSWLHFDVRNWIGPILVI